MIPDMLSDEQMLVCESEEGLAVFSGCSHNGIVSCLLEVQKHFPGKDKYGGGWYVF
ncbi:MAG: hypothetical protein ACYCX2_04050 [Christensenellales bacterium]